MSEKLLPCPFCGGEAVTSQGALAHNGSPWFYIECLTCAATAESPEGWNRRAQPEVAGWQPIETAPKDVPVLVSALNARGKQRTFKAEFFSARTREANCDDDDWGDWDEEAGTYWCPEGWYECIECHEDISSWSVPDGWSITHWMPLPEPPAALDRARKGGE